MDVQAQLAKAVQARFRQMNGIDEPPPPPSTMKQKVKEPVTIPRADPGAKNAAAAALAAKFGNLGGTGPKVSPAPSSSGGGGRADDEAIASKYRKMMKVGMPAPAVQHKMMADGVPKHIIDSVMKGDAPAPKQNGPAGGGGGGGLSPEEEQIVSQYRKMAKVGMPEGAIRHKMSMAGVASKLQDAVFAPEASSSSSPSSSSGGGGSSRGGGGGNTSSLSPEDEKIATPFRKMMKIGMPEGAVRQKMAAAGVSAKIQDSVIAGESAGAPSSSSASSASASSGSAGGGPVSSLSPEDEAIATQYRKMMKFKMPQGAIMQKMALAGVPQHVQDSVLKGEVPAAEPAPTSYSSAMPVNPLAAMIAGSGGIGSLKTATPNEKHNNPSGMPGNPLAAAIAASDGRSSLKKSAPGNKPVKASSAGPGGLLGELMGSGFKGSLKKSAPNDRAPPKPSSSGGLLGELTASGFKGGLKKTSDHRPPPPKPSASGGLLGELSASGFKGSLKKAPVNRSPPMKSASTGNTDFNKLLEERQKRLVAAATTDPTPPRNKLPPSSVPPTGKLQPNQKEAPKENSPEVKKGFGKFLAGRKNKAVPQPKEEASNDTQPLPLPAAATKIAPATKPVEKVQPVPKKEPVKTTVQLPVPAKIVEKVAAATPELVEKASTPFETMKSDSAKDAEKETLEASPAPRSPQKIIKGAGSHIAAMLSRRQNEKAASPVKSPVKQESAQVKPPMTAALEVPFKEESPQPSKPTHPAPIKANVVSTKIPVPPTLLGYSPDAIRTELKRTVRQEAAVPAAFAAVSKPSQPTKAAPVSTTPPVPTMFVQSKEPPKSQAKASVPVPLSPELKYSPAPIARKSPGVPKIAVTIPQQKQVQAASAPAPAAVKVLPRTPIAIGTNAQTAPSHAEPESKAEPKAQVKKEEKVTYLANGKQKLDVARTTVNADGTQARERKRKTKNSDKKKAPAHDEGVDQHCACVVM